MHRENREALRYFWAFFDSYLQILDTMNFFASYNNSILFDQLIGDK
jgi:hypothetical protein